MVGLFSWPVDTHKVLGLISTRLATSINRWGIKQCRKKADVRIRDLRTGSQEQIRWTARQHLNNLLIYHGNTAKVQTNMHTCVRTVTFEIIITIHLDSVFHLTFHVFYDPVIAKESSHCMLIVFCIKPRKHCKVPPFPKGTYNAIYKTSPRARWLPRYLIELPPEGFYLQIGHMWLLYKLIHATAFRMHNIIWLW